MKQPRTYHVYVTVSPSKRNGLTEPVTGRVCTADTIAEADAAIQNDRVEFARLGFDGARTYQTFKAEWQEV
jgi:hypothetical protein